MAEDEVLEYSEPNRAHLEDCGQCQQVSDSTCIFYTKDQERMATIDMAKILAIASHARSREDYVVELGFFFLPQSSRHTMWYLFTCPECLMLTRSEAGGFEPRLTCGSCGFDWSVTQERFYRNAGHRKPSFRTLIGKVLGWRRNGRR